MSRDIAHIRIVTRRASRRIQGDRGQSHNLCGAPETVYDVAFHDATSIVASDCAVWPVCATCRDLYLTAKASRRGGQGSSAVQMARASFRADLHGGER